MTVNLDERLERFSVTAAAENAAMRTLADAEARSVESLTQLIEDGLSAFDAICDASRIVREMPEADRDAHAPTLLARFARFYDQAHGELSSLRRLEQRGYVFQRANDFRHAVLEARTYGYESGRLLPALLDIDAANTMSLDEAMNELRGRHANRLASKPMPA